MTNARFLLTGASGFIGSHLTQVLTAQGIPVRNADITAPKLEAHKELWTECDIMSREQLGSVFTEFAPTHVVHLAAKANLKGTSIADFPENTVGTENLVHCVNAQESVRRVMHFSTQYVVRPGVWPESEEFLLPYTPYGESKAESERILRASCERPWVILRPTNVWGPRHPHFPYELWQYLERRLYFHPGFKPITKYYAYIDNAVEQIAAIAAADDEQVVGKVFYITDPPIDNAQWMDAFSQALSGRPVRKVPLPLWQLLAVAGDIAHKLWIPFPMSSERLFRLTVNEQVPLEPTLELVGPNRVALPEGVQECVEWYQASKPARAAEAAAS